MNSGLGQTIGGRYKIITQLGQGGFGRTFVARDEHLPGRHRCVVKQLKPQATDPLTLKAARRLFETEAQVLYQLGNHDQIPRLFAYFEENKEFYLVQELIDGDNLSKEFAPGQKLSEHGVISLLREILEILEFVHQQNVIHRDVNPRNLIRCKQDDKLVLIDFGAVKQVSTQIINGGKTSFTIAIGTPGYRPSEQANGNPRLSSDIYAVGMLGIQALTGIPPDQLPTNPDTGEISWQDQSSVSPELAKVLDTMVRYDFRERYQSATSALQALKELTEPAAAKATIALPALSAPPSLEPVVAKLKRFVSTPRRVLILVSVLSLGIAATISAANLIKSANATDLYNRGETLLKLKRYEAALDAYDRAIELKPEYAEAWNGQGNTFLGLKRYEDALDAYDKAIQIQPNYLEAWTNRGKALDSLRRYEEAIQAFEAALKIQPDYLEALNSQGDVQIKMQQYSAAIASFDKVVELKPDYASAWERRGWTLHNMRQYDKAVESYDKAVKSKPDFARAWYNRGNSFASWERYPEAVESYDKAVQFQPNFYQAWYSRGSALNKLQQYERAIESFDEALEFHPDDAEAWYGRGWALHQLKRYEDAVTSYNKAIKFKRDMTQAWYNLGNAFFNLERYPDAIASYNRTVEIKSDHYEAWYSRGNALVNLKRYQEAIDSYDRAIRYEQDFREAIDARNKVQSQLEATREKREEEENAGKPP